MVEYYKLDKDIVNAVLASGDDKTDIIRSLESLGAKMIISEFNIANGDSIDIHRNGYRYYLYPRINSDNENQRLFREHNLPFLGDSGPSEYNKNITILTIPYATISIDKRNYKEQNNNTDGSLGAMEIMYELGDYLGNIYNLTGKFPEIFNLSRIAFVHGDKNFLKLIPPIILSEENTDSLTEYLKQNLDTIDPYNSHSEQVDVFRVSLLRSIKHARKIKR